MTSAPPRLLHVINRASSAARVRLFCANQMIWDVWITSMGDAIAPAFVPQQLSVEARMTDPATRVAYHSVAANVNAACAVTARLALHSGARMFTLDAREAPLAHAREALRGPHALHVRNECGGALDFVVRYRESPYRIAGFVMPGGTLRVPYAPLELVVVLDGLSVQRRLVEPDGAWVIATPADAGGFPVIEPLAPVARDAIGLAHG